MTINISLPDKGPNLRPLITVMGVGGAGGNAVNNMISSNLEGVDFLVANTDAQALEHSTCERKIQLGLNSTRGLGAGMRPDIGRQSAEECIEEIKSKLEGSHMVFIAAGMGGGTGTGASPVIAQLARENGILTVGVITKPFHFEGTQRMKLAEAGIEDLQQHVDTLIIIPNQNLFHIANEKTTFADAFKMADDILYAGVRGVTDLMIQPGLINLDFSDIKTVMSEMGKAMMGTGQSDGENRAIDAAEAAIANPLIDDVSLRGAKGLIINITGGNDLTLYEVDEAANRIKQEVQDDANIIYGTTCDERLEGTVRVSIVATGIDIDSATTIHKPVEQTSTLFVNNSMYQQQSDASINRESTQSNFLYRNNEEKNSDDLVDSHIKPSDNATKHNEGDESSDTSVELKSKLEEEVSNPSSIINDEDTNLESSDDSISTLPENSDITEDPNGSASDEIEKEDKISLRKLSLFDSLDEKNNETNNVAAKDEDLKTEPTLNNNDEIADESEQSDEFNPGDEPTSDDINQDKEEELLDIPTFLRRQAN